MSKSDEYDSETFEKGLTWVKNTINDKCVIGPRILSEFFTWINAAYAVHGITRITTSGDMSMCYDIIHGKV